MKRMKFPNIRLIVTDLDGTVLLPDQEIPMKNLTAMQKAQAKGIYVSVASGRAYAMYEAFAKKMQLQLPVIALDGGELRSPVDGAVLASFAMDTVQVEKILRYAQQENMDYITYVGEEIYFIPNSRRIERFLAYNRIAARLGCKEIAIRYYGDEDALPQRGVLKILLLEAHGQDVLKMRRFAAQFPKIHVCAPEAGALDLLSCATSKGLAVQRLAKSLRIDMEQVCVLGDCMNDASMFALAGYSIAMGGASIELQSMATAVTDTCENFGFAKAIEKYIL